MRPLGVDDCSYDRMVNRAKVSELVIDLADGLKKMHWDFHLGRCTEPTVYDYDTGIAYVMVEQEVEKDFTMEVLDITAFNKAQEVHNV